MKGKRLGLVMTLVVIVLSVAAGICSAEANANRRYETRDIGLCGQEVYKGWPVDWWATYALEEFDKYAPPPGVDWLKASVAATGVRRLEPNVSKFAAEAKKRGWVVKQDPKEAMVGAMAIRANEYANSSTVYIVRKVFADRVLVEYIRSFHGLGYVSKREITFEQLGRENDGSKFMGYIWPVKE